MDGEVEGGIKCLCGECPPVDGPLELGLPALDQRLEDHHVGRAEFMLSIMERKVKHRLSPLVLLVDVRLCRS